jgi:IS5 family transposase
MVQLSFLSLGLKGRQLSCQQALEEISRVIPWEALCKVIEPYYPKGQGGRPAKPLELMLKIDCLQQWYGLSDPGMEDAIYDRNSFQQFLKLDLLDHTTVPDETTILTFRHLLEKHKLGKELFEAINTYLQENWLLLTRGTIVDAPLITAPDSSKKTREHHKAMQSRQLRKNAVKREYFMAFWIKQNVTLNSLLSKRNEMRKYHVYGQKLNIHSA